MDWLDDYERRARLIPGLWLVAPVVIVGLMFSLRSNPVVSGAIGLLGFAGGPVVLSNFVRHRGLAIEKTVIQRWGGWPSTQLLLSGAPAMLAQRRTDVERATGVTLPPVSDKPSSEYDAAVSALRNATRDRARFPLVYTENRNYGYERNMLGVRPLGLITSIGALIGSGIAAALIGRYGDGVTVDMVAGLVLLALMLVVWLFVPSEQRLKDTGFKYAERLLEAARDLEVPK